MTSKPSGARGAVPALVEYVGTLQREGGGGLPPPTPEPLVIQTGLGGVLIKAAGGSRFWGGLAQGLGICSFAFGGAYWPLATAYSDPLWVRTFFGCVNGAPG